MVISEVTPNSAASDAGLAPGTLIQQVNRQKVHNSEDFAAAFRSAKDKKSLLLLVSDGGHDGMTIGRPEFCDSQVERLPFMLLLSFRRELPPTPCRRRTVTN